MNVESFQSLISITHPKHRNCIQPWKLLREPVCSCLSTSARPDAVRATETKRLLALNVPTGSHVVLPVRLKPAAVAGFNLCRYACQCSRTEKTRFWKCTALISSRLLISRLCLDSSSTKLGWMQTIYVYNVSIDPAQKLSHVIHVFTLDILPRQIT